MEEQFYRDLHALTEKERIRWDLPSVSFGVLKDGKVVDIGFLGQKTIPEGAQPDPQTLYQIGSASKAFTAAGCAILADRGLLEWDRPIHEYLPWLSFSDPYLTKTATIRDFLCHRTGLSRHDDEWVGTTRSRQEVAACIQNLELSWPFRSKWGYQNLCYVACGCLIEELSGMTWEQFVQKELLEPLHMDRTQYYLEDLEAEPNHAFPYDRPDPKKNAGIVSTPLWKFPWENKAKGQGAPYGPAGSLQSCIQDMMKWVQFQLNHGMVDGKQLISRINMDEMHKPQMLMGGPMYFACPEASFQSYGFGWMMEKYRGIKLIHHGGNIPGYGTMVAFVPEMNLGIVCLINMWQTTYGNALVYEIVDHYLGIEGGCWFEKNWQYMQERLNK